jgi:hypothetical protein
MSLVQLVEISYYILYRSWVQLVETSFYILMWFFFLKGYFDVNYYLCKWKRYLGRREKEMLLIYVFHAWMQIGMELVEVYMSRTNHQSFISISFLSHSKNKYINKQINLSFYLFLLTYYLHIPTCYSKSTRLYFLELDYICSRTAA